MQGATSEQNIAEQQKQFYLKIKDVRKTMINKEVGPTKQQLSTIFHLLINQVKLRYRAFDLIVS